MKKYTNTQLKDICKKKFKIFNNHNFANGQPFIEYIPQTTGRAYHPAYWRVTKSGERLSNTWGQEESIGFGVNGRMEKQVKLGMAFEFAKEKFGVIEWARGPFGGYYDKTFCENRLAEIIAKHEDARSS